jgi:hypothetical protein
MDTNIDKLTTEAQRAQRLLMILPESLAPWSLCLCGESFHYSCPFAVTFVRVYPCSSAVKFWGF